MSRRGMRVCLALVLAHAAAASAQTLSQRGFVEGVATWFPEEAPNDSSRGLAYLTVREEVFAAPAQWVRFSLGLELHAGTDDLVDEDWDIDFLERGTKRQRLSIRSVAATVTHGPFAVDIGKQFIRWGKTDIVSPTDRFAPQDFLNVFDRDFLGVTGIRATAQFDRYTFEAVWVPWFTPSRIPLAGQRWALPPPPGLPAEAILELSTIVPEGTQKGVRFGYLGDKFEYTLSYFDGFNHFPDLQFDASPESSVPPTVESLRAYPRIRVYGADWAIPNRWFTLKGEAAYFTAPDLSTDEYLLYVLQLERQVGEWSLSGGYVGQVVTERRSLVSFAPDRGLSEAFMARVAFAIDPNRRIEFEGAVRQNGAGAYGSIEYSHAYGRHWRATVRAIALGGSGDDFLGQYGHNSNVMAKIRYSF